MSGLELGDSVTTVEFLSHLRSLDLRLWVEGGQLRYSASAGAMTPALRAELSKRKAEILSFLREAQSAVKPVHTLRPVARKGEMPLSYAQQRLWFLHQLEPGSTAYNVPFATRLRGSLNAAALGQALAEVTRRHESLRTSFPNRSGQPVQLISASATPRLSVVDLSQLPKGKAEELARRLAAEEASLPFDLERGPMLRATLLRMSREESGLLLTMHHIVSDGWSVGVLQRELTELYGRFAEGEASKLEELRVQYADYAVWQREKLSGESLEAHLAYWRERLAGLAPKLELPFDRARPAQLGWGGASVDVELSGEAANGLRELARAEGATMFMTTLALFQTLLHRYSGEGRIGVGTPVAGRTQEGLESLIGFFVNTLVVVCDFGGRPSFRDVLRRVKESCLGAYAHQEVPFERLVEELRPERSLGHTPLFQVMFALDNEGREGGQGVEGVEARGLGEGARTAKFELTLSIEEAGGRLKASWEYNTELFEEATVRRMAEHFDVLARGVVRDPDARVDDLEILTEAGLRQALSEWNDTRGAYADGSTLHALVTRQAALTPDRVALVFEQHSITFGELERRALRLASRLRRMGVGPDRAVGVCLERSPELIVALLAVLKAGGAYVPLDPGQPEGRVRQVAEDASLKVMLTREGLLGPGACAGARLLYAGPEWFEPEGESEEGDAAAGADVENIAYVIYTSGSTGRPKGVMIPHRAICNRLGWGAQEFPLDERDRVLQVTTISFDVSVWEIFAPLAEGACLVLARQGGQQDVDYLSRLMCEEEVTILNSVPSLVQALMDHGAGAWARGLRKVYLGGDAMPPELPARFHACARADLYNFYGPTETTIDALWFECARDEAPRANVPIGRPVGNFQAYVLNERMRPAPPCVAGELYVGGAGVARGYLNEPALTAERFVPDPFAVHEGERLYRTGDLARHLPDGKIEFQGRIDHQVKVRGFRVEPGEIEAALSAHPSVRECVVVARTDASGSKSLVAYVVTRVEDEASARELRAFLSSRLPAYMVPSSFVSLKELPQTSSGKLDRRALPAPAASSETDRELVEPRDSIERELASIWREVLGMERVGVRDNFFEVGGHSLMAVRLMARVRQQFGRELPLATLFHAATIEALAEVLRQNAEPPLWSPLVPIQTEGTRAPLFFVHPIGGQVLCYRELARRLGPEQPFYGLQAPPLAELGGRSHTIEATAAHYVEAVRAVRPEGPYLLGGWSFGGIVAFEMAQQLSAQGQEVRLLAMLDTGSPLRGRKFDLGDDATLLSDFVREAAHQKGRELLLTAEDLRGHGLDEQLARVHAELERVRLAPTDLTRENYVGLMRRHLQGFKSRARAASDYEPRTYDGRVTLFRAAEIDNDVVETYRRVGVDAREPDMGWGELSTRPVEVRTVPGYHETMCQEPNVGSLAELLRACVDGRPD